MTPKNHNLYKRESTFVVRDTERFEACIDRIGSEFEGRPSVLKKDHIPNGTIIISAGFREDGSAVFKLIVGEAWRHDLIFTNITQSDHPLNIGLEKYQARKIQRTNLGPSLLPAP